MLKGRGIKGQSELVHPLRGQRPALQERSSNGNVSEVRQRRVRVVHRRIEGRTGKQAVQRRRHTLRPAGLCQIIVNNRRIHP